MFIEDLKRLELKRCIEFYGEWTQVATSHNLVLDALSLILGYQLCSGDATLGTCLIKEVNYCATEGKALVYLPVQTTESLPVTIEVICLVDIGVGLTEVTETRPKLDVLGNHITWIQLDEHLWNLCHDIACGIDGTDIAIIEGNRIWLLAYLYIAVNSP